MISRMVMMLPNVVNGQYFEGIGAETYAAMIESKDPINN